MANFSISATTLTFPDGTTQTTAAQSIPSGTKTNFFQAAAPTGWTQCTTYTCYSMRIVNGTGGGTGGSVNFTTAFASQTPAGTISGSASATTLTTCQIPSHSHAPANGTSGCAGTNTSRIADSQSTGFAAVRYGNSTCYSYLNAGQTGQAYIKSTGGGSSHTHGLSASFSGTAINLAVKYIDNIMATKT
jgi:hypothetical protein